MVNTISKFFLVVFLCSFSLKSPCEEGVFEYSTGEREVTIIVVQGNDVSFNEAKKLAMKRAAEATRENGFKYFIIKKREKVTFVGTKKGHRIYSNFPYNIYQREIVERGMGREPLKPEEDVETSPAIKLIIEFSEKKTSDTFSSCDFIDCY